MCAAAAFLLAPSPQLIQRDPGSPLAVDFLGGSDGKEGHRAVQTVEAIGHGSSEKAAVEDALRNAVEQTAGVLVQAESRTNEFALEYDRVRTVAEALVDSYEVLAVSPELAGDVTVRIRAAVDTGPISEGAKALAILAQRLGNPSFAVIWQCDASKSEDLAATLAAVRAVNRFLQQRLLNVVDPQQVAELRKQDGLARSARVRRVSLAQEVADKLSADIYVTVACQVEQSANVDVKFFESSTGRMLGEDSGYGPPVGNSQIGAKQALEEATTEAVDRAFHQLLSYWRRDTSVGSELTVIANGLDFDRRARFRRVLARVCKEVKLVSVGDGRAEFTVWTTSDVETVMEDVYRLLAREGLEPSTKAEPQARGHRLIFSFEAK